MNATASGFVRDQGAIDREHLRLLAIFHFVAAGMALLGLLFFAANYALVHLFFSDPQLWSKQGHGGPPPQLFFMMLRGFSVFFSSWLLLSGVLNVLSGLFLRSLQHRGFSLVVAAFNCLHIPLGTILGIFTFIVLGRDSVARAYAEAAPRP
jgi:Na+-driven multidrug efflux pump